MKTKISIFWFRRDLRLEDNTGLNHALNSEFPVLLIFIFDEEILNKLDDKADRRVDYIHQALQNINNKLKTHQSKLTTFLGKPLDIFKKLHAEYDVQSVYCNRDYEPQAINRDRQIYDFFKTYNIPFKAYKDQVIFDKSEITKPDGLPYTVYTPYSKKWKLQFQTDEIKSIAVNNQNYFKQDFKELLSLDAIGFRKTGFLFEEPVLDLSIIKEYDKYRDFPALQRTTQLGTALRFGIISIRKCTAFAAKHNQTWLNELIWREFFMQILYHFPNVTNESFKPAYDTIIWRNNEQEFERWCTGTTGYPIVDAGMGQLKKTGYMHNRVRMITASFLCKHLLINWRWGEAYFAQKLNDYDLAANNGNWQWAAGSGCDAAPYFRVFNPQLQTEKFDKDEAYIKKWIPEYGTDAYAKPIVQHSFARERALTAYKTALKKEG